MGTIRMRRAIASLVLSQTLSGCGSSARVPSAPSLASAPVVVTPGPVAPSGSVLADATLSGTVYELVGDPPGQRRGIEGVSVYCEPCGESTHNFADTDANGAYVFPHGVWTEGRPGFPTRVFVKKDGYRDPPNLPKITSSNPSGSGWREVVINGDTRFDIELVRD